jgi:hypothetical protein
MTQQAYGNALDIGVSCAISGLSASSAHEGEGDVLEQLPIREIPSWLAAACKPLGELPIRPLLEGSVYYPACGVDGDPVKHLGGNSLSFVYVDYGVGRRALREELETFRGYRVFASRPVREQELVPKGWSPRFPEGYVPQRTPPNDWVKQPFAEWIVYERLDSFPDMHGPTRFSLLYIGGDGAASYQALYHGNNATPAVVAVIRPGTGFGGNWTDFQRRDDILAWSVLDAFPERRVRWLLQGGQCAPATIEGPCWPEYTTLVRVLQPGLQLWERPRE